MAGVGGGQIEPFQDVVGGGGQIEPFQDVVGGGGAN